MSLRWNNQCSQAREKAEAALSKINTTREQEAVAAASAIENADKRAHEAEARAVAVKKKADTKLEALAATARAQVLMWIGNGLAQ